MRGNSGRTRERTITLNAGENRAIRFDFDNVRAFESPAEYGCEMFVP
jgi:hypothetical protein